MNVRDRANEGLWWWLTAAAPFAVAVFGPLLPLLIVFAGTLPAAAPHPPLALAWVLVGIMGSSTLASIAGLCGRGIHQFPKALWAPLAAFLAAQLVALAWAIYPKAGVFSIVTTLAAYVILLSSTETLRDTKTRRTFLACFLCSAIGAVLFACALSVTKLPPAMFAYEHGRASGTFLQPNEFAGYLLFVIPVGLAQIAAEPRLRKLGLVAAAVAIAGLFLSVSRAAIISAVIALFIFVQQLGRKAAIRYALGAALGLILLVTVFRDVAHDPSENASRLAVWAGAWRMAQRFTLTGIGPFGFHLVYPQFRLPQYSTDEVHAHSLPLHMLIEYGVLGLGAMAWLVVAAMVQCARAWRSIARTDREKVLLFAGVVSGFAASALQNSIDVVTTFLLVLAWPMLGLLLAMDESRVGAT